MLAAKISNFVDQPEGADFNLLALEAFRHQYERSEVLQQFCRLSVDAPVDISSWKEIPPIPIRALDSPRLVAVLSGESPQFPGKQNSELSDLPARAINAGFTAAVPVSRAQPAILSLSSSADEPKGSGLSSLFEHLTSTFGGAHSSGALTAGALKTANLRSWLGSRQRLGRPVIILTDGEALRSLLDSLARLDLRFRLPPGSSLVDFGSSFPALEEQILHRLAIPPEQFVRAYRPDRSGSLATLFFARSGQSRNPPTYQPPHWARIRILEPETLDEASPGTPGLISILDLANAHLAVHVLSEDLGVEEDGAFRLAGRATQEDLSTSTRLAERLADSVGLSS
jgi:hypothetical protein